MMKIQNNIDLKDYNTFKIPAIAKYFCEVENSDDILKLIGETHKSNKKYFLGEGANTIFVNDFDGLVIKNNILGKKIISQSNDTVQIEVGAGENRNDFVLRCAKNNFVGMENLAYIPSSVGATAVQNIGAYGVEAKDIIKSVEGVNLKTRQTVILNNKECDFGYRESIFKNELKDKFIITHVIFELKKFVDHNGNIDYKFNTKYNGISDKISDLGLTDNELTPLKFVEVITEIRKSKLPDREQTGTAGSFFKNPVIQKEKRKRLKNKFSELKGFEVDGGIKLSAGQLIDMCGFKGKNNGKVGTYKKHALILVNEGTATGQDVKDFANKIQKKVQETFDVLLEPEAIFVE